MTAVLASKVTLTATKVEAIAAVPSLSSAPPFWAVLPLNEHSVTVRSAFGLLLGRFQIAPPAPVTLLPAKSLLLIDAPDWEAESTEIAPPFADVLSKKRDIEIRANVDAACVMAPPASLAVLPSKSVSVTANVPACAV